LLHPRIKERRAARNFVASMIGLVRGINDGLNGQRMVNSFDVDEGGGGALDSGSTGNHAPY
jgi:hypothetical protein